MEKQLWCFKNQVGKAFVFPQTSDNSYVSLKAQLKKPLKAFTVCLHIYSKLALTRGYSLFSYATKKQPNEILIFWSKGRGYIFGVRRMEVLFKSPECSSDTHLCQLGVRLWDCRVLGGREIQGEEEPGEGSLRGGRGRLHSRQEQDAFAGEYDKNQSLVGDTGDVNMWDHVLSPEEISTVYAGGTFSPKFLDWRALRYKANGEVFVKPKL
uniref:Pentraxin family member n=1 Tax=Catagonus wagneri TaxID=51154 RepID=A0A8C3XAF1_9CETA